jgi:ABC-type transport system substrate-binding protein
VLLKIAAAHHLAFDFEAANAAWAEAFSRPEPLPDRLEPTQRVETLWLRDPGDFVPGYTYDVVGWSLAPNLYRGLLRLERGLDVSRDLAEHVAVSRDGRVYRFRLRQGLRWSDGEPLAAADFAFTYRAMQEPRCARPTSSRVSSATLSTSARSSSASRSPGRMFPIC